MEISLLEFYEKYWRVNGEMPIVREMDRNLISLIDGNPTGIILHKKRVRPDNNSLEVRLMQEIKKSKTFLDKSNGK